MPAFIHPMKDRQKVVPYLQANSCTKVALVFLHGVGDVIMFREPFFHLMEKFPAVDFTVFLHPTMEPFIDYSKPWYGFDSVDDSYDICFVLDFPLSEGTQWTKGGLCAEMELGLPNKDFDIIPFHLDTNKQVALHIAGTCSPGQTNPSTEVAAQIYTVIQDEGFLPIDVHFEHRYHNPSNQRPTWMTTHVRGQKVTVEKMYSLINNSHWFIGVTSGPLLMAMAMNPSKVICLQGHHKIINYTKIPVRTVNIFNFQPEILRGFLRER
jgi:ADP-heptose:LPS heptosyltransferase